MFLDPRLEADSTPIIDLPLCQVRLIHDARFPWILLIPQQEGLVELIDLSPPDQHRLMQEIALVSQVMRQIFQPSKLNVATLGNKVPQLHIHVIARDELDAAWPDPVWNKGSREEYDPAVKRDRLNALRDAFETSVPPVATSLLRHAHDLCVRVAQDGFDWDFPLQALSKVQEETTEVLEELHKPDSPTRQKALLDEMGDLLLACVFLARHCHVDPEEAILLGIAKFTKRYTRLKSFAEKSGLSIPDAPRAELAALWQQLKKEAD